MPRRRSIAAARFPMMARAIITVVVGWCWAGCWILLPVVPREAAAFQSGGATPAFLLPGPQRKQSFPLKSLPASPLLPLPFSSSAPTYLGSSLFRHRSRTYVPTPLLLSSSSSTEKEEEEARHSEDDKASGSTASSSSDNDDNDNDVNPYADPNYPDLEFVNYADPEYSADRGLGDDYDDRDYYADRSGSGSNTDNAATEAEIERMREERRQRNDEYQFQTYFASILQGGDTYKGEWTVYKSSSFLPNVSSDPNGLPRLVKAAKPLKVVSRAFKVTGEDGSSDGGRGVDERIVHEEVLADRGDRDPYKAWQDDVDVDRGFGSHDRYDDDESEGELDHRGNEDVEEAIASEVLLPYWPENLQQPDFRGPQGIMCVGNAYTIATAVPLYDNESDAAAKAAAVVPLDPTATTTPTGPYREYRAELGIQSKALRFRIKLNYAVPTSASSAAVPADSSSSTTDVPPLVLKTLVVCREARGLWPRPGKRRSVPDRWSEDGLYGPPGAPGGLYDPPPIDAAQATQYLLLDLEGRATALFPYQMDQSPNAFGGTGWVASLDWTPDSMRFQVDRKVHGGAGILGLKTLELSEVQSEDADKYRPRDGGQNMRQ